MKRKLSKTPRAIKARAARQIASIAAASVGALGAQAEQEMATEAPTEDRVSDGQRTNHITARLGMRCLVDDGDGNYFAGVITGTKVEGVDSYLKVRSFENHQWYQTARVIPTFEARIVFPGMNKVEEDLLVEATRSMKELLDAGN
jgi:hypothetical protein